MKAFLMYRDRDFDLQEGLPASQDAPTQDLALDTLFEAMASGDKFLLQVARTAVLASAGDLDTIHYRQGILKDCLRNPSIVRAIYDIAVEAIERERKVYLGIFSKSPGTILHRSVEVLQMLAVMLKRLRSVADSHAGEFESEGFTRCFAMLRRELDDAYFTTIRDHLAELKFNDGILVSAELAKGNKGANYVLRKLQDKDKSWLAWFMARREPVHILHLHPRDEAGARALSELRDRGINLVANAVAQSVDHILSFLRMLRAELGFYITCLNLHGRLVAKGEPTCFPLPADAGDRRYSVAGLYDICLSLTLAQTTVSNDVDADGRDFVVITGANRGGKSTFLRSVGVAQLMMQCGMFVPARSFRASICDGLFTHFKREEDTAMKSGKLDEELGRMSVIVDRVKPHSLLLLNESFAATNEREGSEIARQITGALLQGRIRIFYVTHLYAFAHQCCRDQTGDTLFLRAERRPDGARTFRVVEGEPLQTSYGQDLYDRILSAGTRGDHRIEKVVA